VSPYVGRDCLVSLKRSGLADRRASSEQVAPDLAVGVGRHPPCTCRDLLRRARFVVAPNIPLSRTDRLLWMVKATNGASVCVNLGQYGALWDCISPPACRKHKLRVLHSDGGRNLKA
jgi:hypothetical protein